MSRMLKFTVCLVASGLTAATVLWAQEGPTTRPAPRSSRFEKTRQELWRSSIEAPAENKSSGELDDSIRYLESLSQGGAQRPTTKPAGGIGVGAAKSQAQATSRPARSPTTQQSGIAPETLEKLKKLGPEGIPAPTALADGLFAGGHLDQAAVFYEIALQGEIGGEDRAWALYQLANCGRTTQPLVASARLSKLIDEHPDCLWSEVARVQQEIIDWLRTDDVSGLIEEAAKLTEH